MRPALCEDALRLGRILAELAPQEPEVHGLVALMEIQASRSRARVGPVGRARSCSSIRTARSGISCSSVAVSPRSTAPRQLGGARGPYALQAAIAACHARARTAEETDWARIARALRRARPARAVARRRAEPRGRGWPWRSVPQAGLELVDALDRRSRRSQGYHLLPSVRGDLLAKLGRLDEARAEFERAASLTRERSRAGAARARPSLRSQRTVSSK